MSCDFKGFHLVFWRHSLLELSCPALKKPKHPTERSRDLRPKAQANSLADSQLQRAMRACHLGRDPSGDAMSSPNRRFTKKKNYYS